MECRVLALLFPTPTWVVVAAIRSPAVPPKLDDPHRLFSLGSRRIPQIGAVHGYERFPLD